MPSEPGYACNRGPNARCVAQYQGRLSGPLLDRFDLTIDVPPVTAADLLLPRARPRARPRSPRGWRRRAKSRSSAIARSGSPAVGCNAAAPPGAVEEVAEADGPALGLLREAAERMRLSARGYHRVLKLARTLGDLDGGGPVRRRIWPRRCPTAERRTAPPPPSGAPGSGSAAGRAIPRE